MTNDVYKQILNKKVSPYFIAEIGINHNGNFDLAKKMILAAKESGADCVKFQSLKASKYISSLAQKAPYQINETKFNFIAMESYGVNDNFPKLTGDNTQSAITAAKYDINPSSLKPYLIELDLDEILKS